MFLCADGRHSSHVLEAFDLEPPSDAEQRQRLARIGKGSVLLRSSLFLSCMFQIGCENSWFAFGFPLNMPKWRFWELLEEVIARRRLCRQLPASQMPVDVRT